MWTTRGTSFLIRVFDDEPEATRAKITLLYIVLIAANALAWLWALVQFGDQSCCWGLNQRLGSGRHQHRKTTIAVWRGTSGTFHRPTVGQAVRSAPMRSIGVAAPTTGPPVSAQAGLRRQSEDRNVCKSYDAMS